MHVFSILLSTGLKEMYETYFKAYKEVNAAFETMTA